MSLNGSAMLWHVGNGSATSQAHENAFFRNLYRNIAKLLSEPAHRLFDFEARGVALVGQIDGQALQLHLPDISAEHWLRAAEIAEAGLDTRL